MKVSQRHGEINNILAKMKVLHEKHFPVGRPLTDEEWQKCIDDFLSTTEQWKGTNLEQFAGDISMAFLDDIERVHKAWEKRRGYEIQEAKQE